MLYINLNDDPVAYYTVLYTYKCKAELELVPELCSVTFHLDAVAVAHMYSSSHTAHCTHTALRQVHTHVNRSHGWPDHIFHSLILSHVNRSCRLSDLNTKTKQKQFYTALSVSPNSQFT